METIEDCRVSPPPGTVAPAGDLPLTFLDVFWFSAPPIQRLFFYSLPHPSSHLSSTVVADLKTSLAISLQYFHPYAANLVFPLHPQKPYISYKDGDSVQLTVVESKSGGFVYLSGDHPREVAEIQALVPRLPAPYGETQAIKHQPIMKIQITLFPRMGMAIGLTFLHVVADGRSFSHFMKMWAAIHRSVGDANCVLNSLPCHDRHLIKDENDTTASVFLDDTIRCQGPPAKIPSEKLRATFFMSDLQIAALKERVKAWILTNNNSTGEADSLHVSMFVVCAAYIWVCLIKLEEKRTQNDEIDDELCHLIFFADCREKLKKFHVPAEYFGNCISPRFVAAKKAELVGENGLMEAAKGIGQEIQQLRDQEPFADAENWLSKTSEILKAEKRFVMIAGSPKFRVYQTDFGFGKPKKTDCAHLVNYGFVCIDGGRDGDGGVELGLVVAWKELDTLTSLFEQGLK